MARSTFYEDIKNSVTTHFGFLSEFGFAGFKEEQLAYELHLKTQNDAVAIDIAFEAVPSTPIWAKVGGYSFHDIEPDAPALEAYRAERADAYDALWEAYVETREKSHLERLFARYAEVGAAINDRYLKALAEMLKRHPEVLRGELSQLEHNAGAAARAYEAEKAAERMAKGTYTLEFCLWGSPPGYDASVEFDSLDEAVA